MGMGRGKSEGRRCPRTQEASHLGRLVTEGVSAGPGGRRPGPGGSGCRHHRLQEALHVLGAELGSPSKSSPGSAVLQAPYTHPPSTVSGPTADGAQFPKGNAVRPSLSTYCVPAGSRHQQAVGAVGANQACPAPQTVNLISVPKTSTCSCDQGYENSLWCSSGSQGCDPGRVCWETGGVQTGFSEGGGAGV